MTVHPADALLLGFARALRAAGIAVTADRERTFLTATALVGLGNERGTYVAGRATLCSTPHDLERYDRVYAAWFGGEVATATHRNSVAPARAQAPLGEEHRDGAGGPDGDDIVHAFASATEVLRHRDIAELTFREREQLAHLFAALKVRAPQRRALRHTAARRGRIDAKATLRDQLRRLGEPGPVRWRRRGVRNRQVVLLVDVSGSMSGYADALLRLSHRLVRGAGSVEVFTIGTRLTQVTKALAHRDPERALVAAGNVVSDWSGGTRLAQGLGVFLDRWGRRGMARGAVVVVFSDGWEREAPEELGEQMRRLRALAHKVVWVNPHRGKAGYQPVQAGMAAALPHIDDFLAGHSLATFADLVEVVAHA